MRRVAQSGLTALCLVALGVPAQFADPSVAPAHVRESSERWTFGGAITTAAQSRNKLDPVNIFIYPHAISYKDNNKYERYIRHFQEHWTPNFGDQRALDDFTGFRRKFCQNTKFLSFPARSEPRLESDWTWVGWSPQRGPEDRCKTRFHARLWYDDNHLGDPNTPGPSSGPRFGHAQERGTWIVSPVHHERTNIVRPAVGGEPRRPALRIGLREARGHWIDQDWDAVERSVIRQARHRRGDHTDPFGRPGRDNGHCADYRWKSLPGSRGWFGGVKSVDGRPGARFRGFHSDGKLSRISMVHCRRFSFSR